MTETPFSAGQVEFQLSQTKTQVRLLQELMREAKAGEVLLLNGSIRITQDEIQILDEFTQTYLTTGSAEEIYNAIVQSVPKVKASQGRSGLFAVSFAFSELNKSVAEWSRKLRERVTHNKYLAVNFNKR